MHCREVSAASLGSKVAARRLVWVHAGSGVASTGCGRGGVRCLWGGGGLAAVRGSWRAQGSNEGTGCEGGRKGSGSRSRDESAGDVHREGVVAAPWQRSHPCRRTTRTTIRIDLPTLRVTQHPSVYGHADEVVVGHCTTPSSGHCATRSRNPFWFPPRGPVMHVSPFGRGSRRKSRSSS